MAVPAVGTEPELSATGRFLDALARGPRALVIAGEAGIGKTTLWKRVISSAKSRSFWVLSCRPTQSETALSFAALADLLAEVPQRVIASIPGPQQRGIQVALLQAEPEEAGRDNRAISAGLLSVLAELASEAPVVVAVDDLRWLDRASARVLEFAVRRLGSLRVGLLATMRTPDEDVLPLGLGEALEAGSLERIEVAPLPADKLHRVIREQLGTAIARPSLMQIQEASGGNPFFALEIARAVQDMGERMPASWHIPISSRLGEFVEARIGALSPEAREQLLIASAMANPTVELLFAASETPGGDGLREAEMAGVIEIDRGRVRFSHPLLASAVYSSTAPGRRRALHARIAEVVTDIEEKARHVALSSHGPDDAVAAVLDAGAERADARGAPGAAAELAEHALSLTPPGRSADVARRTIASAAYHVAAGDRKRARTLLEDAIASLAPGAVRATALRLLGEIRYYDSFPDGARLWTQALVEAGDDLRLRATLESHLSYAYLMMADFHSAKPHAMAALSLATYLGDSATLAEALAMVTLVDVGKGTPQERMDRILELEDPSRRMPVGLRPSLILASVLCWEERLEEAAERFAWVHRQIRDRGEESELPFLALPMVWNECWLGHLDKAERLARESLEISFQLGDPALRATSLAAMALVHAYQGDTDAALSEADEATVGFRRAGWITFTVLSLYPIGLLELSLGDCAAVDRVLGPLVELVPQICAREPLGASFLPDEIEALVELGELDRVPSLIEQLEARGVVLDRAWALATAARCRALFLAATGDLDGALEAVERAVVQHKRLPMPFELARTLVVKGQIQRRRRERLDAKESFKQALGIFESRGAGRWAQRARREMQRLGLKPGDPFALTETERQVAGMVASGLTNREVADRLFISPKTVEANLSKIYAKCGVRSRTELAARMQERAAGDVVDLRPAETGGVRSGGKSL